MIINQCIYCGVGCDEFEPEHDSECPFTTGLWPVTLEALEMRGPNDPYAHGMVCIDCGSEFKVGDVYTHRQSSYDVYEVVCVGCRVLNPELHI